VLLASASLAAAAHGVIKGQRYSWVRPAYGVTIPEIIAAGMAGPAAFVPGERRDAEPPPTPIRRCRWRSPRPRSLHFSD
jgi:hypothetical protein